MKRPRERKHSLSFSYSRPILNSVLLLVLCLTSCMTVIIFLSRWETRNVGPWVISRRGALTSETGKVLIVDVSIALLVSCLVAGSCDPLPRTSLTRESGIGILTVCNCVNSILCALKEASPIVSSTVSTKIQKQFTTKSLALNFILLEDVKQRREIIFS